jgi:selenide,water dikinase
VRVAPPPKEVVLVGAGHAHVQVLRRQLMDPLPGARLTLVVDRPVAVYSGMLPGLLSGRYRPHELEIDALPLARRAGVRVLVAPAIGVDVAEQRLLLRGRPPLRYDLASLDVGSTVSGLDTPGVREHALPTRPIAAFEEVTERAIARLRGRPAASVVVVGAGAAGTELAFCAQVRLRAEGVAEPRITVVDARDRWARGRSDAAGARVAEAARERGITLRAGRRAVEVRADAVLLDDGESLPADLVLWVTGAVGWPWLAASGLPVDARGFVRVADTLAVHGAPGLFAVGDCAVPDAWPDVPKAGVHAVRAGPVLIDNLAAALAGAALRPYRPQRDYFALLDLGDGEAVGDKWGLAARGRWLRDWKERIDRRFVERFQVLGPDGAPAAPFAQGAPPMAAMERPCGGCGAKVGPAALAEALRGVGGAHPDVVVGVEDREDVGVVRLAGGEVAVSVDGFPAFCDDPWRVGHAAARNATSDLWCKGLRPRAAVAWVTVPEETALADLPQVLDGLRAALADEGVALLGGHTTTGPVLSVGLTVLGPADRPLWRQGGLAPGDALVLTRPLGTGVVLRADLDGLAPAAWAQATWAAIARGNRRAAEVAAAFPVRAATDVTGFGLAGHLGGMLRASGCGATLDAASLPALPGALALLARGLRATSHGANRLGGVVVAGPALSTPAGELLFDPQTGGGLLLGVPAASADALVAALREAGDDAARIGVAVAGPAEIGLR